MAEKDKVFSGKIKSSAVFDFKDLYGYAYKWLVDEGYWVIEKKYSEKVGPSKEIEIDWEASKTISDYFKFHLKISWRIVGLKDVEVEKNGEKVKMNKATIEIKVSATLIKDYENNWEKNAMYKFMRGVYDKYLIRSRIESYEDKVHSQADEFLANFKAFLALEGKR